jgi:hypothetical protein
MNKIKYVFIILFAGFIASCSEDYLETAPTGSVDSDEVFTSIDGAQAALNGIYRRMRTSDDGHDTFGMKAVDLVADFMGEDIVYPKRGSGWFFWDYQFDYRMANWKRTAFLWESHYSLIRAANQIITQIQTIETVEKDRKNNYMGQAYAIRAFSYFRLVQLYQHTYKGNEEAPGVPIYTEPTKEGKPRATVAEVYELINTDLDKSIEHFENSSAQREHPSHINKSVAHGLYARVALTMEDWSKAASEARLAREGNPVMNQKTFTAGFDNQQEQNWMWGLIVNAEETTTWASYQSHIDYYSPGYTDAAPKYFAKQLKKKMATNDIRYLLLEEDADETDINELPYNINNKFNCQGAWDGDYVMMRAAEMILIEAEAEARGGNESDAQKLIHDFRLKRYMKPTDKESPISEKELAPITETGDDLVELIWTERRIELWGEGFRLFDLKRNKLGLTRTDEFKPNDISIPAGDKAFVFQIPQDEVDANKYITEGNQNP